MARVVLTAPRPRVRTVAEALRADGHEVLELPFVSIEALTDAPAQRALLASLARFEVAIFVSPTAVDTVLDARPEPWPEHLRPAVVGPGSLEALAVHGLDGHPGLLVPEGPVYDAAALLAHPALAAPCTLRVLVVRAEGGNPRIEEELAARGARVTVLCAYRRESIGIDAPTRATLSDWLGEAAATARDPVFVVTTVDAVERLEQMASEPGPLQRLRSAPALTIHPRIAERLAQGGCSRVRLIAPGLAPLRVALESEPGGADGPPQCSGT